MDAPVGAVDAAAARVAGLGSPELPILLYEAVGDVADSGRGAAHDVPLCSGSATRPA